MVNYSDKFEVIFDRCWIDIRSGNRTVEECLQAYPQYRDEFEPLFRIADQLSIARQLTAPETFRTRAISNFNAIAQNVPVRIYTPPITTTVQYNQPGETPVRISKNKLSIKPVFQRPRFSTSFAYIAAIVLLMVVISSGLAFASNGSAPSGALYPVKLAIEDISLALMRSEIGDQQLHLEFAGRRLAEVDRLLQQNRPLFINIALDNYLEHINIIKAGLFSGAPGEDEQKLMAARVIEKLTLDEAQLIIFSNRIVPEQRASVIQAIDTARQTREMAGEVIEQIPDIRQQIRSILESTHSVPPTDFVPRSTSPAQASPILTKTPEPYVETEMVIGTIESIDLTFQPWQWLTNTPDWEKLATLYPSIYPTLSNLATRFPLLTLTPRPQIRPTTIRGSGDLPTRPVPTAYPIPPILPTR